MDKRRRDSGKRLSEAERSSYLILPMRALWKNSAIQYLYSTFNSFYRKVTWHPWRTSVRGLPLISESGLWAQSLCVWWNSGILWLKIGRVGQTPWGQIYRVQLCHVWTTCQASASTRVSNLSRGTSASQSAAWRRRWRCSSPPCQWDLETHPNSLQRGSLRCCTVCFCGLGLHPFIVVWIHLPV